MNLKIMKSIILLVCVIILLYLFFIPKIELKQFEKLKISTVASSFSDDIYLISANNDVYLFKNKKLKKIDAISNAKKIISTTNENVILDTNNEVWLYDSQKNSKEKLPFENKVIDISNGKDFYAILDYDGQVWTSVKLIDADNAETNGFIKINNNYKVKKISAGCFSSNEKYIAMLDENDKIRLYGNLNNICNTNDYQIQLELENITEFDCGIVFAAIDTDGKAYIMGNRMMAFDVISGENYNNNRKKDFSEPLLIDNNKFIDLNRIKISYRYLFVSSNINQVYYSTMDRSLKDKPKEIKGINKNSQVFFERFGVIEVCDNGKVYLHKYNNLFQEFFKWIENKNVKNADLYPFKTWDFIPLHYYINLYF